MAKKKSGLIATIPPTEKNVSQNYLDTNLKTYTRNPKVWQGEYINVHLDKNGHYQVHLKNLEMGDGFNAVRIGNAITNELLTAKKVLGL